MIKKRVALVCTIHHQVHLTQPTKHTLMIHDCSIFKANIIQWPDLMFSSITWPTTHLWRSSCWEPTPSVTPWRQSASSGTSSQFWPSSPSLSVPRTKSPKNCLSTTSGRVRSCQPLFAWSRSTEFSSNYQHSSSGRVPSSPLGKHLLNHVLILSVFSKLS